MGTTAVEIDYKRICTILCFVLGIACLIWGTGKIINQYKRNTSFLPVKAVVLSTDINRQYKSYWPVVNYEYQVGDKTYRSRKVFSMFRGFRKDWARNVAGQFKEDSGCDAFYNPENPADAYLVKYFQFTPYGINFLSLLFFLLSVTPPMRKFIKQSGTSTWKQVKKKKQWSIIAKPSAWAWISPNSNPSWNNWKKVKNDLAFGDQGGRFL